MLKPMTVVFYSVLALTPVAMVQFHYAQKLQDERRTHQRMLEYKDAKYNDLVVQLRDAQAMIEKLQGTIKAMKTVKTDDGIVYMKNGQQSVYQREALQREAIQRQEKEDGYRENVYQRDTYQREDAYQREKRETAEFLRITARLGDAARSDDPSKMTSVINDLANHIENSEY